MLRAGIIALLLPGCSFVLVSGPPSNHREVPAFDCTTSRLGPILDTVWTGLQSLNFASAALVTDAQWDENFQGEAPFSRKTGMIMYGTLAAAGAAGMLFGFTRTSKCRGAKRELAVRMQQPGAPAPTPATAPPGVGTWPPPPPAPDPAQAPDVPPPAPQM